ncbi:MAG: polysaccharide deacetylase family protein [Deltaproteobacteria bacterium]|nr:polysaccharide deacetylase family protein [Deltaproteobacteria bacterium]
MSAARGPGPGWLRTVYRAARGLLLRVSAAKHRLLNVFDRPIVILLYHRVTELASDPERLAVTPSNFRRHLEFLKGRFRLVRFEEPWTAGLAPAVVVTFDDGYADNVIEALPLLEEVGVPATFFVSTGHLDTSAEFWWHRLERLLLREDEFPERFVLEDPRYGGSWRTGSSGERRALYGRLNFLMQKVPAERRERWLEQLGRWADGRGGAGGPLHRSMTVAELKRLAESPWVTIGAHTVTHSALAALTGEEQRAEIFASKEALERILGRAVTTFSYPFGRKRDYDRTSVRLCREAGFVKAASNFPGQVHRWTDPFQLPRHLVRDWDLDTFAAQVESFWTI